MSFKLPPLPTKQGWITIGAGVAVAAVALAKFWLKTTLPDPIVMGAPIASWILIILSHYQDSPSTVLARKRALEITKPSID
jgi:hypothetical protein